MMEQQLAIDTEPTFAGFALVVPEAGEVIVVDVDGTPVAVTTLDGGSIAFEETCTHRECPLSEGTFDGATVTCPCHKSRFDLRTGEPLNGPATLPIRVRAVRVEDGRLFIER